MLEAIGYGVGAMSRFAGRVLKGGLGCLVYLVAIPVIVFVLYGGYIGYEWAWSRTFGREEVAQQVMPQQPADNGTVVVPDYGTGQTNGAIQTGNNVIVDGVVMGVVDPQTQVAHPAPFYLETGISGQNTWTVQFPAGTVLIAGGTDVNDMHGGVLVAYDTSPVTLTVTNGFVLVTTAGWANDEFCFRYGETVQYGWANQTIRPLSSWTACQSSATAGGAPVSSTPPATGGGNNMATSGQRRPSGTDVTIRFEAGESVFGWRIELDNGQVCDSGNCLLTNAPLSGSVTSGVVNYWPDEIPSGVSVWVPSTP